MSTNGLLAGLNQSQTQAVLTVDGPVLVLAGAGTGKTEVLTRRMANMVLTHGIDPAKILAVTFSRDAAGEMNTRLQRWLGASSARVGTFHSVALGIIRAEGLGGKQWEVQESLRPIIKVATGWGDGNMDWKDADPTYLDGFVSAAKVALLRPTDPEVLAFARARALKDPGPHTRPDKVVEAYKRIEALRISRGVLTFDDFVPTVVWAFQADETLRLRWAQRWTHGLQDETQDQGPDQLTLAELLFQDHKNYLVVGDPAQSIYGFRGALPERLLSFKARWPEATVVKLEENYRSGAEILNAANQVVRELGYGESTLELRATRKEAADIMVRVTKDFDTEAAELAMDFLARAADAVPWKAMAVLVRTNAQTRALEEAFLSCRIPYVITGAINFYERAEVKNLLAYLRVISGAGTLEDILRILNVPNRFLGKAFGEAVTAAHAAAKTAGRLSGTGMEYAALWADLVEEAIDLMAKIHGGQRKSARGWADLLRRFALEYQRGTVATADPDARKAATPSALLHRLVEALDYMDWLTESEGRETPENSRVSNVREMVRASSVFSTVFGYLAHVEDTVERAAEARRKRADRPDAVTITTIHRAKGLEWPIVALIGVNEGILPHHRGDQAEECRLFYVGVTRARDTLRISHCTTAVVGAKERRLEPSRFLALAGLQ